MHTSAWVALRRFHCNPLICLWERAPSARLTHVYGPCVLAVLDGAALRIDDRLRVAKERREEADKQQGKSISSVSGSEFFGVFKPSGTN